MYRTRERARANRKLQYRVQIRADGVRPKVEGCTAFGHCPIESACAMAHIKQHSTLASLNHTGIQLQLTLNRTRL